MKSVNVHVVSKFVLKMTNQSIKELNESNMEIYEGNEYYFLSSEKNINKSIITQLEEIESKIEEAGIEGKLTLNDTTYITSALV